jgi:molecular chaperone GrpE
MVDEDDVYMEQDGSEELGADEEMLSGKEGTKLMKLKKELEVTRKEKQEYLDGWQRAKADYVNALKRFEEEKKGLVELGTLKASRAFITAIDSLGRAEQAGAIPESFQGVAKQLHEAVTSLGLTQFGEVGETFDPTLHEALGQDVVTEKDADGIITVVLESGWKTENQIVRPAKVRVGTFS